ncbi:MAG: hypothetical protein L7F78_21340, partial [Syntrophales bacterium LBB04]|nr:hypothetical protein [Syntrophales bacterium LBB04]
MNTDLSVTTFPSPEELARAVTVLETMRLGYNRIEPHSALLRVAVPALVMNHEVRGQLLAAAPTIVFSGWVDYRTPRAVSCESLPPVEEGDCFRRAAIMVLSPCVADEARIRLVAHLEGDLGPVLPYLNAIMPHASYTPDVEALTYMKGPRLITLYRHRITVAKADELLDAWWTLEEIRRLTEKTWIERNKIKPSSEMHRRAPGPEIFKRLPG